MNPYLDGRPVPAPSRLQFLVFGLAVVLAAGALSTRLFAIQIGGAMPYTALAATTRTVVEPLPSTRGVIFDRNGKPLVSNTASYSVKIRPADLPESRRAQVVSTLAALVGEDPASINVALDSNTGSSYDLVRVAQDVDPRVAGLIAESSDALPGVQVVVDTRRDYVLGPLLSQVLGYTAPISGPELSSLKDQGYLPDDLLGRTGVESEYESVLRGQYGLETVERDAAGRDIQVLRTDQPPVAGSSVKLSIDVHQQQLAQQALQWGMKTAGLKRGVVIVMNPQTGEILALVSLPTYDDNLFSQGISPSEYQALLNNPQKPLVDHAISDQYPPGSTYKLVAGTGVLADGKITASTKIRTAGSLSLASYGSTTGTAAASACATSTAGLGTRATRSSTRQPPCWGSTETAIGASSTASGRRRRSTCRTRPSERCPRTSGSSTRSGCRSTPARSTWRGSARATSRSRRSSS